MNVSPFDHPFLSGLLGDEEVAASFAAEADVEAMLAFEAALAEAEAKEGLIPAAAGESIATTLRNLKIDPADLREGTAKDGVVVSALVERLRSEVGEPHGKHVHFGATSQDVIDTSLALRLGKALDVLDARLRSVVAALDDLDGRFGTVETMAHTRMQAAIPVPASRKIASWRAPLERHAARLDAVRREILVLTFGGAAGTLDKLGDKGAAVTGRLATRLGLLAVGHARHSERDAQAELANWLSLVTGSLGKMGQDIALAAQNEVGEITISGGGGSSAMPHKVNPVGAEVLVALARFNATLVSGMHHALVHENERSGAAWTLEWMLLPQMIVATGAALRTAGELLKTVSFKGRGEA